MILYIENPKDSTQKLLELINEFSKIAGYKINIQKSGAFLYTNNERSERECKKKEKKKNLGINLSKEVKNLFTENYKTLIKEIENDSKKWKDIHALVLEELILLKWPYYPKQPTDLMQSL